MSNIRFFEKSIRGKSLSEKLTIVKHMLDSSELKMLNHLFEYLKENPEFILGLGLEHRKKFRQCHQKLLRKLYSKSKRIWERKKFLSCVDCNEKPQFECRFKCIHMFQYLKEEIEKS